MKTFVLIMLSNGHANSYIASCACTATTTRCEKIEHKRARKMSIQLYFKPVSSLPTPEETGIGAVATKEANKAVQRVHDEQEANNLHRSDENILPSVMSSVPRWESMLRKMATLLL